LVDAILKIGSFILTICTGLVFCRFVDGEAKLVIVLFDGISGDLFTVLIVLGGSACYQVDAVLLVEVILEIDSNL